MAILKLLTLSFVTACYSPDLRDCTVSCIGAADCTGGQVCTAEHYCAASGVTCQTTLPVVDAPRADMMTMEIDAPPPPPVDAPPPPPSGDLHVRVMEKGEIEVTGIGTCHEDCTYTVLLGGALELVAKPGKDRELDRWSGACSGTDPTCTLVPTQPVTEVSARFRKDD